jgi:putative Mg2+ transporter-C (MgtC) family protein
MIMADPSLWQLSMGEATLRISLAVVLGGIIGIERERGNHSAGFRTHILVCVGSALITMLSIYGFSEFVYEPNVRTDPARLAAQIVSGIGFLGAGTILRTGSTISGLTTAASLWVVAAIGIGVGAGSYFAAAFTTLMVLVSLFLLNKLEKRVISRRKLGEWTMKISGSQNDVSRAIRLMADSGLSLTSLKVARDVEPNLWRIRLNISSERLMAEETLDFLLSIPGVIEVLTDVPLPVRLPGRRRNGRRNGAMEHQSP